MASPTTSKTSWLKGKLTRRISGQSTKSTGNSFEENSLDDFEHVLLGDSDYPLRKAASHDVLAEHWEVLTLAKQKDNNGMNRANMDLNHTDGVPVQGGNKSLRKTSNNNSKLVSPILGGRKSALKQDKKSVSDMDRPASAGANAQKSTTNKKKLLTTDYNSSRTPSPGMDRNTSQRSSFRRKGVITPVKESSPMDMDLPSSSGGNFSKIRDTLRIRKGKKKSTKVAQYSVPELNFPIKYQDPFDVSTEFGENTDDTAEDVGHEFVSVDVPHHKPEYCDHCQQAAWGHNQTLKCTSKSIVYCSNEPYLLRVYWISFLWTVFEFHLLNSPLFVLCL